MTVTIYTEINLELTTCPTCGVVFGLAQEMMRTLRQAGGEFYCPNGHRLGFGNSEVDRLKKQLKAKEEQMDYYRREALLAERRRRAAKGQLTKWRNKLAQGACVCCGEVVNDLAVHMAEAHPDFAGEDEQE